MSAPIPHCAIADVMDAVCESYGVTKLALISARRTKDIVEPRHVAFYVAVRVTSRSVGHIGRAFDRDHTTVLNGLARVEERRALEPEFALRVDAIEIAALAIGELRRRAFLPPARETLTPHEIARRVIERGPRGAASVSAEEIVEICGALVSASEFAALRAPQTPIYVEPPSAPPPEPPPPPMRDLVHDLLGAEAFYRRQPTTAMRAARDAAIAAMRAYPGDPEAAALVAAADRARAAEFTAGERDANARYRAAVDALAKRFSILVAREDSKEAAHV